MADADHAAVLELARALPEWFNAGGLEEIARDLPKQSGAVATEAGRVVGWVMWSPEGESSLNLTWIGVEKAMQRRGIGSELLQAMVRAAKEAGAREVFVSTVADTVEYEPYERTRAFYRASGFEDYRVDRGYFKDPRGDYDRLLLRMRV